MMTLTPYLLFDGTCHDAMEFYKSVFGGELTSTKVKDSPSQRPHARVPAGQNDQCASAQQCHRNLGIRLADAQSNPGSRQHGLSLFEWRNLDRAESPVRKTLRRRRRHRSR